MDKESVYELQKIDCNCNNCIFMYRNLDKYNKVLAENYIIEEEAFEKEKLKAIQEALLIEDEANRNGMLRTAQKMKFQFDKSKYLNYGFCSRKGKPITFIPNICQLETQDCFIHRKDLPLN